MVTLADIQDAAERIRPYVVRTPLERSVQLSDLSGTDVWLKLECFQSTGSFNGALVYVVIHAFIAMVCYLFVVGKIDRMVLK